MTKKLYLKPFIAAKIIGSNKVSVGLTGRFKILIHGQPELIIKFLNLLRGGVSTNKEHRNIELSGLTENESEREFLTLAFDRLQCQKMLCDVAVLKSQQNSRVISFYSLLSESPEELLKILRSKKVAIIGCGGLGTSIIPCLINSGVQSLLIVDHDKVEQSNITRSPVFSISDVGRFKVDVIKKWICNKIENSNISVSKKKITTEFWDSNDLDGVDFIVCTADDEDGFFKSRMDRYIYQRGIPYLYSGYWEGLAMFGPILKKGDTPCYFCSTQQDIATTDTNFDFDDLVTPSFLAVNSILAGSIALEIVKYFSSFDRTYYSQISVYDLHGGRFEFGSVGDTNHCIICQ
ncbi:ThiF family adenylyltransferase [Pseudomonas sp. UW4]|uniref:HesA/MoeB/ThiF family protein n=1 Tax=Pseudomonas sp. UW4 TaxID=1207075 RepID=UPI00059C4984|nr:ThiF family adenylyltransferase [Pseudomonas sp. UW4]